METPFEPHLAPTCDGGQHSVPVSDPFQKGKEHQPGLEHIVGPPAAKTTFRPVDQAVF